MRERARREYKTLREHNVPMKTRDGVTLYADVVRPDAPGRFPILVSRTPYNKDPGLNTNLSGSPYYYARHGYVAVVQDCRGRFSSEGEYVALFQEVNDGYDAVEWAARLPWSNGRVGTFGQSYLGATQYIMACHEPLPPSLQCMAPVSGSADYHQSWVYHTGGPMEWGWMVPYAISKGRTTLQRRGRADLLAVMDSYLTPGDNFAAPLKPEWYRHLPLKDWGSLLKEAAPYFAEYLARHDDGEAWWRINVLKHLKTITVPVLHVSSWYDIFLEGALHAFEGIRRHSESPLARRGQRMIIGPWAHLFPYVTPSSRGTGEADFGPQALVDLHLRQLNWFDYWLKDVETGVMEEPPVQVFAMGENRWRSLEDWPPPNAHYVRFYLHSQGDANSLRGGGVLATAPPGDEPPDAYRYDPDDPAPTRGGNNLVIPLGVYDQRPVEERPGVLVYTSETLEQPLEVTGPVTVRLWAASTARDTDFTAKLVDVHPDGYARNLCDGIVRARYRDAASSSPTLIEPGRVYEYAVDLWATSNVFLAGHRIRLEVSSSNFPRFDRNLNTGAPFGTDTSGVVAQQTVYHRPEAPSHLLLPVIPR